MGAVTSHPWAEPEDAWADVDSAPEQPAEGGPPNVYSDVGQWVTEWLAPTYGRHITANQVWCPWWFRHTEAIDRLEGAWRAWEQLRREQRWGGDEWFGISVWWTQHGDPCMDRLLAVNGPFHACTNGKCAAGGEPLPVAPVPRGLFDP